MLLISDVGTWSTRELGGDLESPYIYSEQASIPLSILPTQCLGITTVFGGDNNNEIVEYIITYS